MHCHVHSALHPSIFGAPLPLLLSPGNSSDTSFLHFEFPLVVQTQVIVMQSIGSLTFALTGIPWSFPVSQHVATQTFETLYIIYS